MVWTTLVVRGGCGGKSTLPTRMWAVHMCAGYLNYPFLKAESNERDGGTFYSDELLFTTDDPGSHHTAIPVPGLGRDVAKEVQLSLLLFACPISL
jgi:hypothetical protein